MARIHWLLAAIITVSFSIHPFSAMAYSGMAEAAVDMREAPLEATDCVAECFSHLQKLNGHLAWGKEKSVLPFVGGGHRLMRSLPLQKQLPKELLNPRPPNLYQLHESYII